MHSKLPVPSLPGGYTVGCEGVNKTLNIVEIVCLIHNKGTARVTSERLGKVHGIKVSILILISDVTHESRHKMQSIFPGFAVCDNGVPSCLCKPGRNHCEEGPQIRGLQSSHSATEAAI